MIVKVYGSNFEIGSEFVGEFFGFKGDEFSDFLLEVENKVGNDGGIGNFEVGFFVILVYLEVLRDLDFRVVKLLEMVKMLDVIYDSFW